MKYTITNWFERDRAHVAVIDENENTIAEWWDDDVRELSIDGFLVLNEGERALERSAIEYCRHLGLIK